MDLPIGKQSKKEFWDSHIKAANNHPKGKAAYCRLHGIKAHQLTHQERKRKLAESKATPANFAEVKVKPVVVKSEDLSLPDPKWLAEFAFHWKSLK